MNAVDKPGDGREGALAGGAAHRERRFFRGVSIDGVTKRGQAAAGTHVPWNP